MFERFAIAAALIVATTLIHAVFTAGVLDGLRAVHVEQWASRNRWTRIGVLAGLVYVMSLAGLVESALWAGVYVWVDALPSFHDALYFSVVTFTTLGYGDITLGDEWRLLGSFEAANGIIMFGWTTAIIVTAVQRLYFDEESEG